MEIEIELTTTNSIFYGLRSLFSLNFDDVDIFKSRSVDMDNKVPEDAAVSATNEDYPVVDEFKEPDEELSRKVESEVKDEMVGDVVKEDHEQEQQGPVVEAVEEPVNGNVSSEESHESVDPVEEEEAAQ